MVKRKCCIMEESAQLETSPAAELLSWGRAEFRSAVNPPIPIEVVPLERSLNQY
jgi:hypothetical protein